MLPVRLEDQVAVHKPLLRLEKKRGYLDKVITVIDI
jgi:hypothetical protein